VSHLLQCARVTYILYSSWYNEANTGQFIPIMKFLYINTKIRESICFALLRASDQTYLFDFNKFLSRRNNFNLMPYKLSFLRNLQDESVHFCSVYLHRGEQWPQYIGSVRLLFCFDICTLCLYSV
jgi:hypothetical protein